MTTQTRRVLSELLLFLLVVPIGGAGKDEKMKGADVIARHLEALGKPEARAAAKSRTVVGQLQVTFRLGGQGQLRGKGVFASEGTRFRIDWATQQVDYPGEQVAFDGSRTSVGQIRPGLRSHLSQFLYDYDYLLKEGLLGGALTTAWAPLGAAERQPKLDYSGLKKVEGVQLHEVRYRARKGGEVQVTLYFEPETFRHVRSQHRLTVPARMGATLGDSSSQRDSYVSVVEQFGDFRPVDDLTLPHSYKLEFTIEGQANTFLATWEVKVAELAHNQTLDPGMFSVK